MAAYRLIGYENRLLAEEAFICALFHNLGTHLLVFYLPDEYEDMDPQEKFRIASSLHSDPENVNTLEYVRQHTGFCRTIFVTEEDIERIG